MKYDNKYEAANHFYEGIRAYLNHESYQGHEYDPLWMEGWRCAKFGGEMEDEMRIICMCPSERDAKMIADALNATCEPQGSGKD